MRSMPTRLLLAGALALPLTGCEQPTPPVDVRKPPPLPVPLPPRAITSSWSFHSGDVCTATAGGGALALDVAASRDTLRLVVRVPASLAMPANRGVAIAFAGTSGAWTITGNKAAANRVIASRPMNEDQAGRILLLLGGGNVRVGSRGDRVPELRVPNSGPSGRDWFECVRRQLFP